ncbi:hypothetical protein [Streptomyces fagopyri]|uniref:hypothetical protein n=1 Tax=Streptomyces fagopyri TaxID=2662397 RepID=UPI00371A1ADE
MSEETERPERHHRIRRQVPLMLFCLGSRAVTTPFEQVFLWSRGYAALRMAPGDGGPPP